MMTEPWVLPALKDLSYATLADGTDLGDLCSKS